MPTGWRYNVVGDLVKIRRVLVYNVVPKTLRHCFVSQSKPTEMRTNDD